MNYNDFIKVELAGIPVSSAISGGGYALLLKEVEGKRRIPIIIGHFEAQAIAFELEGLKPPRPLTHELVKNLLEALSYSIESVIINELRDSTFFAKIVLDSEEIYQQEKVQVIDKPGHFAIWLEINEQNISKIYPDGFAKYFETR